MELVQKRLSEIIQNLYGVTIQPELSRPKLEFGDYATNIALVLAGQLGKNPREIAEAIATELRNQAELAEVTVAGPGFINLRLSDQALVAAWKITPAPIYAGKTVVAEYSDPNPFKVLHAGHFYTSVVGDAIANLVEVAGGKVYRANFGGDVGLHVGKTLYGMVQDLGGELPEKMAKLAADQRAEWLGKCYVAGTQAYEDDEAAHAKITDYNKQVYAFHNENDHDSPLAQMYWLGREWSYDYFKEFYRRIGVHFDKFYPESQTAMRGLKEVEAQIGKVFEESDGAIVFKGEKFGLHTRVFINQAGLPTYETKDVGLSFIKYDDYKFDQSIIITADEQKQYMQVVLKAIEQFAPQLALNTLHITHGMVKLAGGVKMSSRKGNFLKAVDILDLAIQANQEQNQSNDERVALGAIKYSFLRPRIGGDIIYDPNEAVSLVGNSGVYLQYAGARACSMLRKANYASGDINLEFDSIERPLAVKLGEYHEVVDQATRELLPHLICTYLYELTQTFSHFYEHAPAIGHEREAIRLRLVAEFRDKLFAGLKLVDIVPLETM